jgi:hypothetical protein
MTTDWTPPPWIDVDSEDCTHPIVQSGGLYEHDARVMSHADYRRAAACLSACEGFATEALEALPTGGLLAQRAALLAACEEALVLIEEIDPVMLDGWDEVPGLLRAAIALARGGAS